MATSSDSEPPRPPGRRARKAAAVRQSLFDAGLAAFERQPIGLVSVLDITEAADVAKGVFYLHFRSKDDYLLALWGHVQRWLLDGLRGSAAAKGSRAARIEGVVGHIAATASAHPAPARFWVRMSSFGPDEIGATGHLERLQEAYIDELASFLAAGPREKLNDNDRRLAEVVNSICWALIGTAHATGRPCCDAAHLIRVVTGAVRALDRTRARSDEVTS